MGILQLPAMQCWMRSCQLCLIHQGGIFRQECWEKLIFASNISQTSPSCPLQHQTQAGWRTNSHSVLFCVIEIDRVAGGRCDERNHGTHSLPQICSAACRAGKLPEP